MVTYSAQSVRGQMPNANPRPYFHDGPNDDSPACQHYSCGKQQAKVFDSHMLSINVAFMIEQMGPV